MPRGEIEDWEPGITHAVTYDGQNRVTQETWSTTAPVALICSADYVYNGDNTVNYTRRKFYAPDGVTVIDQVVKTCTYAAGVYTGDTTVKEV